MTGMELIVKLRQREAEHNPVSVGIIGCGQMGSGLAHAINNIRGMQVSAIADIDPGRALNTFLDMGVDRNDILVTDHAGRANDGLRVGKFVVTSDAMLMTSMDSVEANVEVTGDTDTGARIALDSIARRKPIIMLNVETDVTVGFLLNKKARANKALYTVASGDEPGVCKMLWEQALLMGF